MWYRLEITKTKPSRSFLKCFQKLEKRKDSISQTMHVINSNTNHHDQPASAAPQKGGGVETGFHSRNLACDVQDPDFSS